MGSPKDVRVWSARERKAHYQEQADKLRATAEAQPSRELRAQLLALAEQYQLLANSLPANQHDRLA
jgi:hypothetical protein